MKMPFLLTSLLAFLLLLPGCGGGGGGDGGSSSPTTGAVEGALIVPPNYSLETEPNDTVAQAQPTSSVQKVSGQAALVDPGFSPPTLPGIVIQDLYRLQADGPVRMTLTIAANDSVGNDLDLLLLDENGVPIDVSEGSLSTEVLETPGAGIFLAGVRATRGDSAYLLSFQPMGGLAGRTAALVAAEEFVPGEILVKMREEASPQTLARLAPGHHLFRQTGHSRKLYLLQAAEPETPANNKVNLPGSRRNALKASTLDQVRKLRREPQVEYAEPNYLWHPLRVPNDEFFDLQWHYPLINLPQAWDQTTGSDEVIAAVLDTGILPNHPDLKDRLVPGYDFISSPLMSNDGDGIDSDPTDPGDDINGSSSSFHGTHVAGIVSASTDNQIGVAGATWQTRLMPLRVLGVGGGTSADVAQAIRYAARLSNNSGTLPDRAASVINMSFGGPAFSQTVSDAVQAARAAGVVLVAAAGNENSTTLFYPASYDGVLSVAAVDLASQRAPYSNFGPQIDLAGPGGDLSSDLNGDGHPDGILSTMGDDNGNFLYSFLAGTSMAAPHVSGVIALMRGVNPSLSPADIDQLVAGTHPDTQTRITRDLGSPGRDDLYGHGLIDAAQAVLAALEVPGGSAPAPAGSTLAVSTQSLDFDSYLTELTFEVSNAGSGVLQVTGITGDAPWLTITPASGTAPLTVRLTVDRRDLPPGDYLGTVSVISDASGGPATASVAIAMTVGDVTLGNVGTVFVLVIDQESQQTVAQAETDFSRDYAFRIDKVKPGTYLVVAGTDRDGDNLICDIEDACGFFPDAVTVSAGGTVGGVAFTVSEQGAPQEASAPAEQVFPQQLRRLR